MESRRRSTKPIRRESAAACTPTSSTFPATGPTARAAELCGELIDTGHKTILGLARRFNLATVDLLGAEPNGSTDTYRFFGDYYPADEADSDFKAIHAALHRDLSVASYPTTYKISTAEGIALDNMSIYEWIESRVPGGHSSPFGQLLDVAYNIEYGAETTEQSALNLVYLLGYSGAALSLYGQSDERFHIVGGNTLLPIAIRDSIVQSQGASAVRMGWRLSSVKANADGTVALGFDSPDGKQTVTADHVVLCMSFSVLRTLDTAKAGFDPLKKTAITKLGAGRQLEAAAPVHEPALEHGRPVGTVERLQLRGHRLPEHVGRDSRAAGRDRDPGRLHRRQAWPRRCEPRCPTRQRRTRRWPRMRRRFLDQLEPVFPGIKARWNGKATLSNPTLDPNLLCSYSYWKPGQYHTFSGYEGVRQGNIHFAGEHCSQDFQGYMEGGASEGVRAGSEILADLKK